MYGRKRLKDKKLKKAGRENRQIPLRKPPPFDFVLLASDQVTSVPYIGVRNPSPCCCCCCRRRRRRRSVPCCFPVLHPVAPSSSATFRYCCSSGIFRRFVLCRFRSLCPVAACYRCRQSGFYRRLCPCYSPALRNCRPRNVLDRGVINRFPTLQPVGVGYPAALCYTRCFCPCDHGLMWGRVVCGWDWGCRQGADDSSQGDEPDEK